MGGKRIDKNTNPGTTNPSWHKILDCPFCPPDDHVMGNIAYQANIGMGFINATSVKNLTGYDTVGWRCISGIKYPSIFVNLADGAWNTRKDICITNTDGIRRGAPASRGGEANMVYFRRSNNMNMALGDGHVETVYFQKIKVKVTIDGVNDCVLAHDYYWHLGNIAKAGEIGH